MENNIREKLEFSKEDALAIIGNDYEDFKVINRTITSEGRWANYYDVVVQRVSDNKFFKSSYSGGSTENQDHSPYEYDDPIFTEVFPMEKVVIIYK